MASEWRKFLERVHRRQEEILASGSLAWWRGHRSANWVLRSTLHRHLLDIFRKAGVRPVAGQEIGLLRGIFKTLYRYFSRDALPLLDSRERSLWGPLYAMQHYGLPTRLLDWTESFAFALYFAQYDRARREPAAIFLLDPQRLNHVSVGQEDLIALDDDSAGARIDPRAWHPKWKPPDDPLPSIAVVPTYTNARMVAQRSGFVLMGDSFAPLERQLKRHNGRPPVLEKLLLPPNTFDDARAYLEVAGIDAFDVFPDREGLRMRHEAKTKRTIQQAIQVLRASAKITRRPDKRKQRTRPAQPTRLRR